MEAKAYLNLLNYPNFNPDFSFPGFMGEKIFFKGTIFALLLIGKDQLFCECYVFLGLQTDLVPPWPVIGLLQAAHLLANSSAKQSAQKGLSSRLANFCPARAVSHRAQTKHSCRET